MKELTYGESMTQSTILSPILKHIDKKGYSSREVSDLTGIRKKRIKMLFNIQTLLTISDLEKLQKGLKIVLQQPKILTTKKHNNKYYG